MVLFPSQTQSKNNMFKDYLGREADEVYIGHFYVDTDCLDGSEMTIWESIGWKTKRQGENEEIDGVPRLPEFRPVFVKQDEIKQAKGGEEILANLLPGSYSELDIRNTIMRMTDLISSPHVQKSVSEFIDLHPWTLKYVRPVFSEANQLREMAQDPKFGIILHVPSEREAILRQRHGHPQIAYRTTGPGREFYFRFEEKSPGSYRAISG